ncbi:MAG: prepilin peptidase [Tissierellia bacterium]|nr:prepilin peptidase [Tissierellia bacterium]
MLNTLQLIFLFTLPFIFIQFAYLKISKKIGYDYLFKYFVLGCISNILLNLRFIYHYNLVDKDITTKLAVNIFLILIATSIIIPISIIDFKYFEIPNEYNLFLFLLGIGFVVNNRNGWKQYLISGGICLGVYLFLYIASRGNLGMGDVKLASCLGLMIPMGTPLRNFIMLSFLSGSIISLILLLLKKKSSKDKIAFGPYIGLSYILIYFML